ALRRGRLAAWGGGAPVRRAGSGGGAARRRDGRKARGSSGGSRPRCRGHERHADLGQHPALLARRPHDYPARHPEYGPLRGHRSHTVRPPTGQPHHLTPSPRLDGHGTVPSCPTTVSSATSTCGSTRPPAARWVTIGTAPVVSFSIRPVANPATPGSSRSSTAAMAATTCWSRRRAGRPTTPDGTRTWSRIRT